MHVAAADEAKKLGQMVKDSFDVSYFFILELGPVVGVHVGPGTLGAGFCPEPA
jgi:fatty acid-binding protein DegV